MNLVFFMLNYFSFLSAQEMNIIHNFLFLIHIFVIRFWLNGKK